MQITPKEYYREKTPPAPRYQSPLPIKRQRVCSRGRSCKPKIWSKEEIFLYKCQQASKHMEAWND